MALNRLDARGTGHLHKAQQDFIRPESDNCICNLGKGKSKVILGVSMEHKQQMLLLATSATVQSTVIKTLSPKVDLKDMGEPKFMLRINISLK